MTELEMVIRDKAAKIAEAYKQYQTNARIREFGFDPIELVAQCIEDAEDAERYRWLRDNDYKEGDLDEYVDTEMAKAASEQPIGG